MVWIVSVAVAGISALLISTYLHITTGVPISSLPKAFELAYLTLFVGIYLFTLSCLFLCKEVRKLPELLNPKKGAKTIS